MKYEKYIPKNNLVAGAWYLGFCRATYIAMWDGAQFMTFKQEFQYQLHTLKHFDDVKELGVDGFVPTEIIHDYRGVNYAELGKFKIKIGYK